MAPRLFPALLGMSSLVLLCAAPVAAQVDDSQTWLRECQSKHYGSGEDERFCEIRTTGFKPTGTTLTIQPDENGGAEIIGWDRDSVAVQARIQVGGWTEEDVRALAQQVEIRASGSTVRVTGPSSGRHQHWGVGLVVMVPRKIGLQAETLNGPLSVEDVVGTMDLRAQNGPVSLIDLGGDVMARVENGPLSVMLNGTSWEGKGLDAEAVNGPVTLGLPENYNAELETGTINGPMVVNVPLTVTIKGRVTDRIHTTLGNGGSPVRVVTTNGPITIRRARG